MYWRDGRLINKIKIKIIELLLKPRKSVDGFREVQTEKTAIARNKQIMEFMLTKKSITLFCCHHDIALNRPRT